MFAICINLYIHIYSMFGVYMNEELYGRQN